jgi:hypothetical protein
MDIETTETGSTRGQRKPSAQRLGGDDVQRSAELRDAESKSNVLEYTPDLGKFIRDQAAELKALKDKGKAVNTARALVMADIESRGLNKKAFKRVFQLYEMEQSDRQAMAFTIAACTEALNVKDAQGDLFADTGKKIDPSEIN